MRHNKKINHLGRTNTHREAMLSNMATSLVKHKRIFTTLAKAKALRKMVEPLITKSKDDTTHSRRMVFKTLRDKQAVTELFQEISQKVADRPGGYTRIIKLPNRLGDNATMCFIELVDYNELMLKDKKAPVKAKTRRSRRKAENATVEVAHDKEKAPKAKIEKIEKVKAPVEEVQAVEVPEIEQPVADASAEEQSAEE